MISNYQTKFWSGNNRVIINGKFAYMNISTRQMK